MTVSLRDEGHYDLELHLLVRHRHVPCGKAMSSFTYSSTQYGDSSPYFRTSSFCRLHGDLRIRFLAVNGSNAAVFFFFEGLITEFGNKLPDRVFSLGSHFRVR